MWRVYKSAQICARMVFKSMQECSAWKVGWWPGNKGVLAPLFEPLSEPMASTQEVYKSRVLNSIVVLMWAAYVHTHSNTFSLYTSNMQQPHREYAAQLGRCDHVCFEDESHKHITKDFWMQVKRQAGSNKGVRVIRKCSLGSSCNCNLR